ncbi:MAG: MotA/TolQ/ExbB proton channel family protein [Planctomycetales bacterium]|nr:MotA/TolQ/ExbB proton channel family protein [Planctomycetales bacterium]
METLFVALGYGIYALLAVLALWGAFSVIMVWRRVAHTRFASEFDQDEFLNELEQALVAKNFSGAMELCDDDRRAMPQLALYAITNRELGVTKLQRRVAERFQQDVLADIDHRLSWVNTVIKSAPMIGLLGTVIGMMGAFANLSSGDKVDTVKMAEDIQFALITTACGLAIAVPLVLCTASINIRLSKTEDLVGLGLGRLFEQLKSVLPGS